MTLLTDDEQKALDTLADAWNLFVALPILYGQDRQEFMLAIHAAQNIILARPVLRETIVRRAGDQIPPDGNEFWGIWSNISGWVIGPSGQYLLFSTREEAQEIANERSADKGMPIDSIYTARLVYPDEIAIAKGIGRL